MSRYDVLVVDDEASIRKLLLQILQSDEINVVTAADGRAALELMRSQTFDLMILDLMMGSADGFDIIRQLREQRNYVPILVLSARSDDSDKVYSFSIGADDYVTKPFSPIVLLAKVKAILRRHGGASGHFNDELVVPPFRYLQNEMRLFKNDREIVLTTKESMLMRLFLANVNQVFSMDQLYQKVWGNNIVDNNTIMVHIQRLRKKIEDDPQNPQYIRTIRGLGYQFFIHRPL